MICSLCEKAASFLCPCSNTYLCASHIGEHLLNKGNHPYERLNITLNPFDRYMLNKELNVRIQQLKELKLELNLKTSQIILKIKSIQRSVTEYIDKTAEKFTNMLFHNEFQVEDTNEINKIIKSETLIKKNLNVFESEISKFFSEDFISFEHDCLKETIYTKKLFLQSHHGKFKCLAATIDGKKIVTGGNDCSVRVWDLVYMKQIVSFVEHTDNVLSVAINNDGSLAISGGEDGKVMLWDLRNYCLKKAYSGHSDIVKCVAFSLDEKMIVSAGYIHEIIFWNLESDDIVKKIDSEDYVIFLLHQSENLLLYSTPYIVVCQNLITDTKKYLKANQFTAISSVVTTNDHKFIILSYDAENYIQIWEIDSISFYASFNKHTSSVLSVSVTSDDQNIISISSDSTLILWNIQSKSIVSKITINNTRIFQILSINDKLISLTDDSIMILNLLSFNFESSLKLTSFSVGSEVIKKNLVVFKTSEGTVVSDTQIENDLLIQGICNKTILTYFSSNDQFLICTSHDNENKLTVWDLKQKHIKAWLVGHKNTVLCADISGDDLNAISCDSNSKFIYWDLSTFSKVFALKGFDIEVNSIKISRDKKFVVSSGFYQVIVWSIGNFGLHAKYDLKISGFKKSLITNDDKYIIIQSFNGKILVWNIESETEAYKFNDLEESKLWLENYKDLKCDLIGLN